jgi:hypothetical protein
MTFGHEFTGVVQEQAKRMLLVSKIAPEFETQGLVYRRNESTTKGARTVAQQEYEQSQAIDALRRRSSLGSRTSAISRSTFPQS